MAASDNCKISKAILSSWPGIRDNQTGCVFRKVYQGRKKLLSEGGKKSYKGE